jgi:hypothetical protein
VEIIGGEADGMSVKIEVRVSCLPVQGGYEAIVESKTDPLQRWAKWYAFEGAAATELSLLGLADDEAYFVQGNIPHFPHKVKDEATVDPEELLHYGFLRS